MAAARHEAAWRHLWLGGLVAYPNIIQYPNMFVKTCRPWSRFTRSRSTHLEAKGIRVSACPLASCEARHRSNKRSCPNQTTRGFESKAVEVEAERLGHHLLPPLWTNKWNRRPQAGTNTFNILAFLPTLTRPTPRVLALNLGALRLQIPRKTRVLWHGRHGP